MSEQIDPRTRQRVQALHTYSLALEQGELGIASAVLQAAEHDVVLERMIVELHMASLETTPPIQAEDVLPLQALLHAPAPQEIAAETSPNGASPVANSSPSMNMQKPMIQKGKEDMSTTQTVAQPEQKERHQHKQKGKQRKRSSPFLQTLAAVLIVGMIVGSFILLLAQRRSTSAGPNPASWPLPPDTAHPVIAAVTWNGTVYALQPGSGKVLWQYATHQEVDTIIQKSGFIFVASIGAGSGPNSLYTFRASNGKLLWKKEYPLLEGFSVLAVDDGAIAISGGEGDGSLDVVNARDGSLLWRFTPSLHNGDTVAWAYPILGEYNHVLYIHNQGIKAYQMNTGKLLWTSQAVPQVNEMILTQNALYAIDTNTRQMKITTLNPQNGHVEKTLVLPSDEQSIQNGFQNGILYVNKGNPAGIAQVCAVHITDGTLFWCSPQSQALNTTDVFMPVTIMNHGFYYYQVYEDGVNFRLEVISLNLSNGTVNWHWISTEKHLYSSVNLVNVAGYNGIIYLTTHRGIFAFRSSDGHFLWHLLANENFESFVPPSIPGQMISYPN